MDGARSAAADPQLKAKYDREFERKSVTLKKREARLAEHLKATGLLADNSRVRVDGFGKSVSQKAVWAEKKYAAARTNIQSGNINGHPFFSANADFLNSREFEKQFDGLFNSRLDKAVCKYARLAVAENDDKPSETLYLLSENGKKLRELHKEHYWDSGDVGGELISEKREYILVHNHPNNTPLSLVDILALNDVDKMNAIISVGHNGEICKISIGSGKRFTDSRDYGFLERAYGRNISKYGFTNKAIKHFCEEVGWQYGKI